MNPWILAIRPRTLPVVIGPILVGNILAVQLETFRLFLAVTSMICAILLQISVNLANDYFDFKNGIDTQERLGPIRVTQGGLLTQNQVKNSIIICLIAALMVGSLLIYHGGWPIALLAAASILAALGYSGGPYPLASHGLGEIAAFVFFGLVAVVGSYYLQALQTDTIAWMLGCAIGLFNAAVMLVNNTRDMRTDAKAGKYTLAIKIGQGNARTLYQALVFGPFAIIIGGFLLGVLPGWPVFLGGLSLIFARKLSHDFSQASGAALNPLLGRTAILAMLYSLLFSIGIIITIITEGNQ